MTDCELQIMSLNSALALGYRHRDEAVSGKKYFAYSLTNALFGDDSYPAHLPREGVQVVIIDPEVLSRVTD